MRSKTTTIRVALGAIVLTAGVAIAFVAGLVPSTEVAHAGPVLTGGTQTFCVTGAGTGTPWGWALVDLTGAPLTIQSATVAGFTGTTLALVTTMFLPSINGAPTPPTATAVSPGVCAAGDVEVTISYPLAFSFQVGEPLASGVPLHPVGTTPVSFNPTIRLVPEPTVASGLMAGIVGIVLLGRARARRRV